MPAIRVHMLDASALTKLFLVEPASDAVRRYVDSHSVFVTTPYVIGEVLGVLKRALLKGKIASDDYFSASEELLARVRTGSLQLDDHSLVLRDIFDETERVASRHRIDLVDAHQIVVLKRGAFGALAGESRAILITADAALAQAARTEGLRVWDCNHDSAP